MQNSVYFATGDNGADVNNKNNNNNMGPKARHDNDENSLILVADPTVTWGDFGLRRRSPEAGLLAARFIGLGVVSDERPAPRSDKSDMEEYLELSQIVHPFACRRNFGDTQRLFQLMEAATETIEAPVFTVYGSSLSR